MITVINDTPINYIEPDIFSGNYGGTSSFISGFLKYLSDHKQEANLLGNFINFSGSRFPCIKIRGSNNIEFLVKLWLHLFFAKNKGSNPIFYSHRPDHHAIASFVKGKYVVHLHGQPHSTINYGRNRFKKLIYNYLENKYMPKADLVIATDSTTADLYVKLYPLIKPILRIIPTGIDLDYFDPAISIQLFPEIQPNTSNLAYIGRLAYPKQVKEIITAFANAYEINPTLHLWIAGSGPDEKKLKHLASLTTCSVNIHFTGSLTRESVKSLIRSSDAGILLSHNEGSPIVIKEFLASGKPVIVNNVGDVSQYVTDEVNGYIVDPEQIDSIKQAMISIINNAEKMSKDCRESVLPYNEKIIYSQVYESLLKLQNS